MDAPQDRYSHGHHESVLRSHKWRTANNSAAYLIPFLAPGMSLLDVGCGPGNITADLAERVRPGQVIGVDVSAEVTAAAQVEHEGSGASFEAGNIYELRFDDDSFDVVHAHQVLQHLRDPISALREMKRVAKPGGIVAIRDSDYGKFTWSPEDPLLTRWLDIYHQITERNLAEADAGRYLGTWARSVGFSEIRVLSSLWTFQSDEDRSWWGNLWADRVLQSEYCLQGIEYGLTTQSELEMISSAFHRWAKTPDGSFIVVHGEVLATK